MIVISRKFSSLMNGVLRASLHQRLPAQALMTERVRCYSGNPTNTVLNFVPTQEAWVIERMGKFFKILQPGPNLLIPFIDKIKYVQSLKEMAIEIPQQEAITVDNVQLQFDAVLYLRITDPYKASYGVEDPEFAITQLAQTTMRSEVGKINLDTVFKERQLLNSAIVGTVTMPEEIQKAMRMQVEADRKKRAAILESEGLRQSNMNVAEGEKQARILRSEAEMQEQINSATGVARAIELEAEARRRALDKISEALNKTGGQEAASLLVAEQYVKAFKNLAKEANTLILPSSVGDTANMVSQAMAIYKQINKGSTSSPDSVDMQKGEK